MLRAKNTSVPAILLLSESSCKVACGWSKSAGNLDGMERETFLQARAQAPSRKQSHSADRPHTTMKSRECRQENGTATEARGCKRLDLLAARVTARAVAAGIAHPSMWRHAELTGLKAEQLQCYSKRRPTEKPHGARRDHSSAEADRLV